MRLEILSALWPLQSGLFCRGSWSATASARQILHLFFNMLGLWMFGSELERLWGRKRYAQFLLASLLSAALAQLLITWLTGSNVPTVGASGALFGLLLAFGMLFPNRTIMPLFPPIPMKARTFVIVFGVIELLFGLSGRSGVAHFAHLGGMLGGYLTIRYWRGRTPFGGSRRRRRRARRGRPMMAANRAAGGVPCPRVRCACRRCCSVLRWRGTAMPPNRLRTSASHARCNARQRSGGRGARAGRRGRPVGRHLGAHAAGFGRGHRQR
ncbi:MAG: rhomboid family intramembrane serine protease [Burkholderiaceae bacterium]